LRLILLLLIPLAVFADEHASDVLVYSATACYGTCPVYRAMLFSDGTFIFVGEQFVARKGFTKVARSEALFAEAVELTRRFRFQEFRDDYGWGEKGVCPMLATDNPGTVLTLQLAGVIKRVNHYHGCSGFEREAELKELEKELRDLLRISRFTQGPEPQSSR